MVQITNHFQRAISLLASQFRKNKPDGSLTNFQKLIQALVEPAQEIENVNWELKTERWLNTAIGTQLDGLGQIIGIARNPGESDEDYRERLQFQIFINSSKGTPEDVIRIIEFLTKSDRIIYHETYPAAFQLETDGLVFPTPPNELVTAIKNASPAGVNYAPITATYNVPISFQVTDEIGESEGGFEELNYPLPTAGQLSEVIQNDSNMPPRRYQNV